MANTFVYLVHGETTHADVVARYERYREGASGTNELVFLETTFDDADLMLQYVRGLKKRTGKTFAARVKLALKTPEITELDKQDIEISSKLGRKRLKDQHPQLWEQLKEVRTQRKQLELENNRNSDRAFWCLFGNLG